MYNNPLRILFTIVVIGSFFIGLACSNQQGSNTVNSNQATTVASADYGPCELKLDDEERGAIETKIRNAIRNKGVDKKLKKSLDGDGTNPPWLTFELRRSPGQGDMYYEAVFKGTVAGNGQFEELADILNDFNGKKECVRRAIFLPTTTATPSPDLTESGFEWSACDFPMRPCSNGECNCTGRSY